MARFDTFVFDLDGTLLDTLPDLVVLTNAALNEQGFPSRTADEIHSFVGNGARALMYQAVPADASPEQAEAAMRRWMELYPVIGNKLRSPTRIWKRRWLPSPSAASAWAFCPTSSTRACMT